MKNISVKFAGVFAVVAFALTVAAPVKAQTVAELQALIAQLQSQIAGTTTAASTTFSADLTLGSTGADVVALQTWLEAKGFLTIPAGTSKGYFGELTRAALAKYQVSKGISPAVGYFGPTTRAAVNAEAGVTTGGSNSGSGLGSGEASLEAFDLSSGDDSDVEEGATAEVAEIEFDVEDGDISLNRVDLAFTSASTEDAWDVLEEVRLLVDGDEIASKDLSDEDEYLDEDAGTVRISDIDFEAMDGDTVTIVVEVTTQDNLDVDAFDAWTVNVLDNGIRATDGEGIEQYIGDESDTVDFDVEAAGTQDELNVSSSNEDPEATTLKVEDDAKSDMYSIFAFEIESEESDMEFDTVQVEVETGTADVQDVVADFVLEIDGEEFDDWSFVSGATSTTAIIEFDIDAEYTLDADSTVTAVLMAEFKAANDVNYASTSETIEASIANGAIDAEGADDILSDGVAAGEEHALEIAGIMVDESGFADEGSDKNNDEGTSRDFTFTFEVTAFEEDFYIATSSVVADYEGAGSATSSYTVSSTGEEDTTDIFLVKEGETETFTVVVTLSDVTVAGQYRVFLESVGYTENSNGTPTGTKTVEISDFRTAYSTIN